MILGICLWFLSRLLSWEGGQFRVDNFLSHGQCCVSCQGSISFILLLFALMKFTERLQPSFLHMGGCQN